MKTVEQGQWRRSGVFIVRCDHVSDFVLIVEFKQTKNCWVHIENTSTFEG